MKKTLFILAAGFILAGCGIVDPCDEIETAETAPSSEAEETAAAEETTETEETTTTEETVTTETTTDTAPVTETTEAAATTYPRATAPPFDPEEDIPPEEKKALDKLEAKYGREFTPTDRNVHWEYWNEPIPDILRVFFTLKDEEGREFCARGLENMDVIEADGYTYVLHGTELEDEAAEYLRGLVPEAKLWFRDCNELLPFDIPADIGFEDYRQVFADNEGYLSLDILFTDDMEVPEELKELQGRKNSILPEALGYRLYIDLYRISQEDYDRIDDVTHGRTDMIPERQEISGIRLKLGDTVS
ncbi:MAG: hypothetical protein J5501_02900 [Ruminococcus sp.]|nr:hypothetical protein [Ruminococcus sp.]